ncbi:TBC1 domain family member 31 [Fasciola hepatica]|uniref:TBC1 domain family member 31 n=1 Tax=Fasciola hepatica TaxID=6192 RepID=A0A4E0RA54_FASHE|nr:TBC1 domain family member 31 [Fasciola hepatica]
MVKAAMSCWSFDLGGRKCGSFPNRKKYEPQWTILSVFLTRDSKSNLFDKSATVQPSAVAFSENATKLFCSFQTGVIYVLDLIHHRYSLLTTLGQAITSLTSHPLFGYLYVGLNDGAIHILDQATGAEVGILKGHTSQVHRISVQPKNGKYILSSGPTAAILWNVETRQRKRKLDIQTGNTLASALFIPLTGQQIITCFRDGSLYIWNTKTLECLSCTTSRAYPDTGYSAFAFTKTGRCMFAAGRTAFIDIWLLPSSGVFGTVVNQEHSDLSRCCSAPHVFERIQLPNSSTMIRKLAWIPGVFQSENNKSPKSDDSDEAEEKMELSGYLIVLGNDHRLRCLVRARKQSSLSKNSTSGKAGGDGPQFNMTWKCLFTLGMGTCEDPLISSFELPDSIQSGSHDLHRGRTVDFQNGDYPMALISVNGHVLVISLTAAMENFKKSVPPVVKVEDNAQQKTENTGYTRNRDSSKSESKTPRRHRFVPSPTMRLTGDKGTANGANTDQCFKDPTGGLLERRRLRLLLKEFGHFPEKYRLFIWRAVLQLPNNTQAFSVLLGKGVHPAYELLPMQYPIRDQKLMRVFQKVCSCLAFWSPLFGETDWLPQFIFPFVKLFLNNVMHAFEAVATVLMNWCFTWFEYFPNPPINVLCMVENLLAHNDPDLYHHFVRYQITTEIYAWPLLQTAFSEVFTQNEWLVLWDTILCHPPGVLLAMVVAYAVCARGPLLLVRDVEKFEMYFHGQSSTSVSAVIRRAHQIIASTPPELQPDQLLATLIHADCNTSKIERTPPKSAYFCPLTAPQYPIVTRYPKFIVDFHIRERERIREEEKEYLRQRATVEDMRRRTEIMANEEENWYRQQSLLLDAEERRRTVLAQEEARLRDQRKRLNALLREVKLHELSRAEESNCRSHQLDKRRRIAELDRLEEQLKRLANKRTDEMDAAANAMELARLQEGLQLKHFETMAVLMHNQTDEGRPFDKGALGCNASVQRNLPTDPISEMAQPDAKQLSGELSIPGRSGAATDNWVASSQAVASKDPTSCSTPIQPSETFTNSTLDQFAFTSTKLLATDNKVRTTTITPTTTGDISKANCESTLDDSSDHESEVVFGSNGEKRPPLSTRELRRENELLIAEVETLLDRLKRD